MKKMIKNRVKGFGIFCFLNINNPLFDPVTLTSS